MQSVCLHETIPRELLFLNLMLKIRADDKTERNTNETLFFLWTAIKTCGTRIPRSPGVAGSTALHVQV
jgi:hypothetical protein